MADSSSPQVVGRLLTTLGFAWLALFFVAASGVLGNTGFADAVLRVGLFFPFIVLFVGRRLKRSGGRRPRTEQTPPPTVPRSRPRPPERRVPERSPEREPDPIVVAETPDDDLAKAVGFDDSETNSDQSDSVTKVESPSVEEQPMSSKDMIADARRRLDLDN